MVAGRVGTVLHWASHTVIRSTALAGGSLAVNQTLAPRAQKEILNASLKALDCVDTRAEAAYPVAERNTASLAGVQYAIRRLAAASPKRAEAEPEQADGHQGSDGISLGERRVEPVRLGRQEARGRGRNPSEQPELSDGMGGHVRGVPRGCEPIRAWSAPDASDQV